MVTANFTIKEDYWETVEIEDADLEIIYNHLLETEVPLTSQELLRVFVAERIRREKQAIEKRRSSGGAIYVPREDYDVGQTLIFPALGWLRGTVVDKRAGNNPEIPDFNVVKVELENGLTREFATALEQHRLNDPQELESEDGMLTPDEVMGAYGSVLQERLETSLESNEEFVRIAGRWFPRALLVDVNIGHLNLAEALLDMEDGGPLPTSKLMEAVELPTNVNPKLAEFSLDYALWQDDRFDEVGPAGRILWHLKHLEPEEVLAPPPFLRYQPIEHDRSLLTGEMLALESELDDELSPLEDRPVGDEVEIRLLFPHWRVGSLPLSSKLRPLFPTAYQAPRIRFMLVDGESGQKFPGWVVRQGRYVFGLRDFYEEKGVLPGSILTIRRGDEPGEVIVKAHTRRPVREWIRTVLVGADGGIVLAMLKQMVASHFDDRMAIAVPETETLDEVWEKTQKERVPFERTVVDTLRELAKLNPQGHVHAIELYAAVNLLRRSPPGPILALLASRPWFVHVGDLHFRFDDSERD